MRNRIVTGKDRISTPALISPGDSPHAASSLTSVPAGNHTIVTFGLTMSAVALDGSLVGG